MSETWRIARFPFLRALGVSLWFGFLALFHQAPPDQDGWLLVLQQRLLDGEPAVAALFVDPPVGSPPPRLVRVAWYRYRHATADRRAQGVYWTRELLAIRVPAHTRGG